MEFDLNILKQKLEEGYIYEGIARRKSEGLHSETTYRIIMLRKDGVPFLMKLKEDCVREVERILQSFDCDVQIDRL